MSDNYRLQQTVAYEFSWTSYVGRCVIHTAILHVCVQWRNY